MAIVQLFPARRAANQDGRIPAIRAFCRQLPDQRRIPSPKHLSCNAAQSRKLHHGQDRRSAPKAREALTQNSPAAISRRRAPGSTKPACSPPSMSRAFAARPDGGPYRKDGVVSARTEFGKRTMAIAKSGKKIILAIRFLAMRCNKTKMPIISISFIQQSASRGATWSRAGRAGLARKDVLQGNY